MPDSIPLTPEAAAVVAAFSLVMDADDSTGLSEDSRRALAAALRELAAVMERTVPASTSTDWGNGYVYGLLGTIDGVRSIADNIEQAITYAEAPSNGN